jgi:hypothetical protein
MHVIHTCRADPIHRQSSPSQGASGEKERVSRKKRRNHKTGFTENDEEEYSIDPDTVISSQLSETNVDVKDEVEEFGDDFHGYPCSMAMRALVLHKMSDRATLLVNRCLREAKRNPT